MIPTTSTFSMTASLRRALNLLQGDLSRRQKEVSTGRHADLGSALGLRTAQTFVLAGRRETTDAILGSNQITASRLNTTQVTLQGLLADAGQMRAALISAQTHGGDRAAIVTQAVQSLTGFVAKLNGATAEGFLFGGVATDAEPVANYFASPAATNKLALDAAFAGEFGFSQSSPGVATITPAQIQSFLAGAFDSLFSAANWKADWSSASDAVQVSQVNLDVSIESSVSANDPAFAALASAYVMLGDLGAEVMDQNTYAAITMTALDTLDKAIDRLTRTKARVGVMQSTIQNATDLMTIQKDAFDAELYDLQAVDPLEASAKVSTLMTQIETAYTLTARITQLSLTKYL